MAEISTYLIQGRLSLLKAAANEMLACEHLSIQPTIGSPSDAVCLRLRSDGKFWLTDIAKTHHESVTNLHLPLDWVKLMKLLPYVGAPKAPRYVAARQTAIGMRVQQMDQTGSYGFDAFGRYFFIPFGEYYHLEEADFIRHAHQLFACLGFFKGAHFTTSNVPENQYRVEAIIFYTDPTIPNWHGGIVEQVKRTGFCFAIDQGGVHFEISSCYPTSTKSTTEHGIGYGKTEKEVYFYDKTGYTLSLKMADIKHWQKLVISSVTLPCGVLTAADFTDFTT
jgi:hypothetical protein